MANSFVKKDQELKNRHKNQSVNSKVEEMAKRANLMVEKEKANHQPKMGIENVVVESKKEEKVEVKETIKKEEVKIVEKKSPAKKNGKINNSKNKNTGLIEKPGMSTEEFLNLNIQLDKFEGNNTSITISIDIYEKIKEYSEFKNLTMNFFVNKLIRVGLEKIDDLTIEDIQKNMCYNAKTRALPFYIDENIESEFNIFIENIKTKGYKFSRNTIICALINTTLERFHK